MMGVLSSLFIFLSFALVSQMISHLLAIINRDDIKRIRSEELKTICDLEQLHFLRIIYVATRKESLLALRAAPIRPGT
jgi:hypothetical protein